MEIDDALRTDAKINEDVSGLFITEVEAGSAAQDKGVKAGEIIVQIGQETTDTLKEAEAQIANLTKEGRKNALLMIRLSAGDIRFVVVAMD